MTQSMPPALPPVPVDYGQGGEQRRTSAAAIASLIVGLLGCIPFLTGIAAIVLGVIGIRHTRNQSMNGSGLAVAGLVLGIVSLLGWSGFSGMLGYGYLESRPAGVVAKQFLSDVTAGNYGVALANSSGFTAAALGTQNAQMSQFGALQSVSISGFSFMTVNGQSTVHLTGTATFASGTKTCTFDLLKLGGTYKVTSFLVQ